MSNLEDLYNDLGFYTIELETADNSDVEYIEQEINKILTAIKELESNG